MGLLANILPERRATLENPRVSIHDASAWAAMFGGEPSYSGASVNAKSSMGIAAVWRGVSLIANAVGKVGCHLYRKTNELDRERDTSHPAYYLMRYQPNPEMDAFQFLRSMTVRALLTGKGNAYARVERLPSGAPVSLWPIDSDLCYPIRIRVGAESMIKYVCTLKDGRTKMLDASDMLHIKGLGDDGMMGYDVIEYAKQTLGWNIAVQKYSAIYFKNAGVPLTIIEHPTVMSDQAALHLRQSFDARHAGLDNMHKTGLLEEGAKLQVISPNARQAQLIEVNDHLVRQIANILQLPPHKLGDTTRSSYNSLEMENQSLSDDAFDPWWVTWESELRAKLLTEQEQRAESHYFEFNRQALLRTDTKSRNESYRIAIEGGWMCPDQAAAKENLPPLPDGQGQKYRMPLNFQIIGEEPPEQEPEPEPEPEVDDDDAEADRSRQPETWTTWDMGSLFGTTTAPWQPIMGADGRVVSAMPMTTPGESIPVAWRELLADGVRRICRPMGDRIGKDAAKPDLFLDRMDRELEKSRTMAVAILGPIVRCVHPDGADDVTVTLADGICEAWRSAILSAAECQPDKLADRVKRCAEDMTAACIARC